MRKLLLLLLTLSSCTKDPRLPLLELRHEALLNRVTLMEQEMVRLQTCLYMRSDFDMSTESLVLMIKSCTSYAAANEKIHGKLR